MSNRQNPISLCKNCRKIKVGLSLSFQLNCKYLGHRIEKEIADVLAMTPQLVKLGVTMEFRDSLNRTAIQLQKNLDKRKHTCVSTHHSLIPSTSLHFQEDSQRTGHSPLNLTRSTGPALLKRNRRCDFPELYQKILSSFSYEIVISIPHLSLVRVKFRKKKFM